MNPLLVQEAAAALLSSAGRSGLKNIFSMVVVGILIFAGLGYYLDWYKVQATAGPNGTENIVLNVNTAAIKKSEATVGNYIRNGANQIFNNNKPGYPTPAQPAYPSNYPQQNPQYPTQYQQPTYPQQQPAQYAPNYAQQPTYPQQQPGYYPPAATYPPQQGGWTPTQPASRPAYPPGTRQF
jgi:hypothetical protein